MLKETFPNAAVSYSFPYPGGPEGEAQRAASAAELTEAVKDIH
jgi:hypothetical protein